ncbi:hypothetical protein [Fodinibius salsisoli]|uniref:Uncharacterized protein n=1 Tax=Fodinibius salsisoli TaxID=2820877 RepID=A0ABT3PR05_9BACT|nr:hypothetical protein [Fodinibius salsisoli]MCW9708289.1 hypothetical protein [Fodinibius salsisoli]
MMNQPNSLYQVFNDKEDGGFTENLKRSLDGEGLRSMRQSLTEKSSMISWSGLSEDIKTKAGDLLSVTIPDILIRAWNKAGILNKYVNREKYDPEEVFLIELKEHTVSSKHKPYLDVEVNNKSIGRINVDVDLEILVKGGILKIQDARIRQLRTGTLKISGAIHCEGLEITKKESKEIKIPGKIALGEGIPIAP